MPLMLAIPVPEPVQADAQIQGQNLTRSAETAAAVHVACSTVCLVLPVKYCLSCCQQMPMVAAK